MAAIEQGEHRVATGCRQVVVERPIDVIGRGQSLRVGEHAIELDGNDAKHDLADEDSAVAYVRPHELQLLRDDGEVQGGLPAIEVTLRTPVALDAVRAIAAPPETA